MISQWLRLAYPDAPVEMTVAVGTMLERALERPDMAASEARIKELEEQLSKAEDEILELRQANIMQRQAMKNITQGGLDVIVERHRSRIDEGYDDAHDDAHDNLSLISAAIAYLTDVRLREQGLPGYKRSEPPSDWPWSKEDFKPKALIQQQKVVAANLIIGSLDRAYRLGLDKL